MENREYIFMETSSGGRTNIMSSFQLWDKEMFVKQVKKQKKYHGRYRYGKIGCSVKLVKDMSLDEFHFLFKPEEFTKEQITDIFKKEISLKYGLHEQQAKIKLLGKKQLEKGSVYEASTGQQYLYLGKVERITDKTYLKLYKSEKKPFTIETGLGFIRYRKGGISPNEVDIVKSIKKLVKKIETPKIKLEGRYIYESNEKRVTLNLL